MRCVSAYSFSLSLYFAHAFTFNNLFISLSLSWFTIAIVRYQNQEFVCNTSFVVSFCKTELDLHFNHHFLALAVYSCISMRTDSACVLLCTQIRAICYFILLLLLAISAINFPYLYLSFCMHTFSSSNYLNLKYIGYIIYRIVVYS